MTCYRRTARASSRRQAALRRSESLASSGQIRQGARTAADYQDILGKGNLYCELMDHGIPIERSYRENLLKIARTLDMPLLATNGLHYVRQQDAAAHDVLLCIGTRSMIDDPKRFKFTGDQFYLKSSAEMRSLWDELPERATTHSRSPNAATWSSTRVRTSYRSSLFRRGVGGIVAGQGSRRGLSNRFNGQVPDSHRKQADASLCHLSDGLPRYFLVCRPRAIRHGTGHSRGSGSGSCSRGDLPGPWASPSLIPSSTASCSSGSSIRSASRCLISIWTSTNVVAAT